ncbi:hypothetical protein CHS0354_042521 [Potamilus streckersoni]|uniref:Cytochrome P450 n=1 Tax=Potamilus streckersoni TaxID=2493646 RepID=A0AAE0TDX7_9BIVA|nr:hypothetical protein CHS0354_042521 [Potamilus streckersoni]
MEWFAHALSYVRISMNFINIYAIIAIIFAFYVAKYVGDKIMKYPPGPVSLPLIGNYFQLTGSESLHKKLLTIWKQYGSIYRLNILGYNFVIINGHELIREALVNKGDSFRFRPISFPSCLGQGIIWSNGEEWHKFRKILQFASRDVSLGRHVMEEYIMEGVQNVAEEMITSMEQPTRLKNIIQKAVLNVFCKYILRVRYNFDDRLFIKLLESIQTISDSALSKFPESFQTFNPIIPLSLQTKIENKKYREAVDTVKGVILNIMKEIMRIPSGQKEGLIGKLLKDKDTSITEDQLVGVLVDILTHGFEASSSCILWCFLYLLQNSDVQRHCRMEIAEKIGFKRPISYKDKDALHFINATISEVQRISTPDPISRPYYTQETVVVEGYTIPSGSHVLFHTYSAHMDHTYWKRPHEFRPKHFLDMAGNLTKHEAFFPFGIGPRSCTGEAFASQTVFLFVSNMLQRFQFMSPVGEQAPSAERDHVASRYPDNFALCAIPSEL